MARVFILSINYAPEPTGFAPHAAALSEYLARRGHDVLVFTGFPFAPAWQREGRDRHAITRTERLRGVAVHRLTHFIPRRPSSAAERALMEASFCLTALGVVVPRLLRPGRRPDSILYIGAQPTLAMLARLMARMAGCPYFVNINDLASQAASEVGIVKSVWLRRLLESFEFAAYRRASGAAVLCRSFQDALIAKGYPADRIRVIRSPVNLAEVRPVPAAAEFRLRHGIPESAFVIMYAGSMGLKQGLTNVIEAAAIAGTSRLCWVLVGDGEMKEQLVDLTQQRGLANTVRFLPFQPAEAISQMFAAADALLLNQISAVKDSVIPSKLLTYMAAGKPVLAAVNLRSQGADILHDTCGGLIVSPESPRDLASGALEMMGQCDEERALGGRRNRAYAEQHFDQNRIFALHEQLILASIDPAHGAGTPTARWN